VSPEGEEQKEVMKKYIILKVQREHRDWYVLARRRADSILSEDFCQTMFSN